MIACFNVASLLLVRALSREREIAVRVALGAAPSQLAMQLFAESFVLSTVGAALGIVTAAIALPLIVSRTPVAIARLDEARLDFRALGAGLGVVTVTMLFFGPPRRFRSSSSTRPSRSVIAPRGRHWVDTC